MFSIHVWRLSYRQQRAAGVLSYIGTTSSTKTFSSDPYSATTFDFRYSRYMSSRPPLMCRSIVNAHAAPNGLCIAGINFLDRKFYSGYSASCASSLMFNLMMVPRKHSHPQYSILHPWCKSSLCHPNALSSRSLSTSSRNNDTSKNKETSDAQSDDVKEKAAGNLKDTFKEVTEDNILTVPNLLTTLRLCLSPVIGYQVIHGDFTWALSLFVIAGLTDLFDGYIARNFANQTSALGSFIDPLADKFLVSILFVTLTMVDLIPVTLTAMIIARDVALAASAFYVRYISIPPPVTLSAYFDLTNVTAQLQPLFISKVNTAVQLGLVALSLAAPVFDFVGHPYLQLLWFVTAATTTISGVSYIFAKDTFKILEKRRRQKNIK